MAGNRVEQLNRVCIACQIFFPLDINETEVDGFLVTQCGETATHVKRVSQVLWNEMRRDGGKRGRRRQLVKAHHTGNFFNQVFFNRDVKPEAWWRHSDNALGFAYRKT